jgi:hypothetical protein
METENLLRIVEEKDCKKFDESSICEAKQKLKLQQENHDLIDDNFEGLYSPFNTECHARNILTLHWWKFDRPRVIRPPAPSPCEDFCKDFEEVIELY